MSGSTVLLCSGCSQEARFDSAACIGGSIEMQRCQQCGQTKYLREFAGFRLCDCCECVTWDGAGDTFNDVWLCLYCQPEPPEHLRGIDE